ncbi:MAG: hypothetical protein V1660_00130 [archaeon]
MYKVLTKDLHSLGLRKNPNILEYKVGVWKRLPNNMIKKGKDDYGGIWVVATLGNARKIRDYMHNKYKEETRIFKVSIGNTLYSNSYRLKTDRVKLLEELILT